MKLYIPPQLTRLTIAFAIFISLFLLLRHFLVPDTFGQYGHYRGASLERVFKVKILRSTYQIALVTALLFLLVATLPLISHLSQPQRAYEIMITPHSSSAMAIFGFVYLWYLMVVRNSLLFMAILTAYLFSSKTSDGVNFSFALGALVSARIINWQKSRLKIETDLMRNLYMIEGFIMVLFALIHAVPRQFVTLSWTMAALVYFLVSILLKNVKYRYMALGTMICAAFYLFLVDLARIEIVYRVPALLFLAAISIGISIYYTNRIKKPDH